MARKCYALGGSLLACPFRTVERPTLRIDCPLIQFTERARRASVLNHFKQALTGGPATLLSAGHFPSFVASNCRISALLA